uniref:Uncharacterized protein n=1 Tax=Beihai noda-like virus 22 TaxID=1922476 RepID=A0A1L3KFS9_9VIRU|nr:hypothetical protein 2 [Beihai noda-like virus 22]
MSSNNNEAIRLRDIVRSKDPMDSLCKERLITPEACDWVKCALDPFHDLQLEHLRGFPDVSTEPSVVVKVRQAITVSKPPELPAGATWDCHVVLSPIDFSPVQESAVRAATVYPFGDTNRPTTNGVSGLISGEGSSVARMDGLLINSVPSDSAGGANLTYTPGHCPRIGGAGYELQQINLDNYLDFEDTDLGVYRIVYSGFEVVNTTAQIYKQGAVTVYEYGNSFEVGASMPKDLAGVGDINRPFSQPTTYFRCPPNTIAEAKIMPGAHSWAAQDGCYNTAKFQTDNRFQGVTRRPWAICQNNTSAGENSGYLGTQYTAGSFVSDYSLFDPDITAGTGPGEIRRFGGPMHFSQMNTTGAYFTGLSEQTTLFVTWRVGIERLPAANKPAFLALAQPSATFDPNALVLYSMVANVLPPGCPQGYNDMGKWFKWISDAAQKAIPSVYPVVRTASMLASTMGRPVIGMGLNGLAEALKPIAEKQAANRLQNAVRNKQAKQRGKAAVGNWAKPTQSGVRSGGTNGLK